MPSSKNARRAFGLGLGICCAALLCACAFPADQLALRQRLEAGVQTPDDAVRFRTPPALHDRLVAEGQDWLPAAGPVVASPHALASGQLLDAAATGDLAAARAALRAGADANGRGLGLSPLAAASLGGHTAVVRLLLAGGARPDTSTDNGETPLMLAVRLNRLETAAALLAAGASVRTTNRQGDSLCMVAIAENFPAMLALLLKNGADAHAPDRDGLLPIYWAGYYQRDELVRVLLEAGADPQQKKIAVPASSHYALREF
jgi:hypothetical protein